MGGRKVRLPPATCVLGGLFTPWLGRLLIAGAKDPDGHLIQIVQPTN